MSEFKKGQLVAVRDHAPQEWQLRMFDSTSPGGQAFCRRIPYGDEPKMWWNQIKPAEEVWPELFLARDREIIDSLRQELDKERQITEQNICAVELEQELVQRLRSQIRWLCKELQAIGDRNGEQECPPVPHQDCRWGSCAECWEVASLKAVEGESCP